MTQDPSAREQLIGILLSCDGPPIIHPSVNGYEARLDRWHKSARASAEKRADAILASGWIETPQSSQMDTAHHDGVIDHSHVGTGVGCTSLPSASPPSGVEERARKATHDILANGYSFSDIVKIVSALLTLTERETRESCAKGCDVEALTLDACAQSEFEVGHDPEKWEFAALQLRARAAAIRSMKG